MLFSSAETRPSLKHELKKLAQGSKELLDVPLGTFKGISRSPETTDRHRDTLQLTCDHSLETGVTYEHMHAIVEAELKDSGYYEAKRTQQLK